MYAMLSDERRRLAILHVVKSRTVHYHSESMQQWLPITTQTLAIQGACKHFDSTFVPNFTTAYCAKSSMQSYTHFATQIPAHENVNTVLAITLSIVCRDALVLRSPDYL